MFRFINNLVLPTWLKVVATIIHLSLFIIAPVIGFVFLSIDILPDSTSFVQEALEFAKVWAVIIAVGVVLSGVTLLWTIWGKPPRLVRYYTLSWIILFIASLIPIVFFLILAALSHPPTPLMFLGGMLLMPAPLALLLSTLIAVVPGVILYIVDRATDS